MKYLLTLLFVVSCPLHACISFQEKFDSDAFTKSQKVDEDPIVEAVVVYVPARIEEYEADYSYIYLKEGNDLILGSTTSVMVAPIPKSLPSNNDYKALFFHVQKKYKNSIELEVHFVRPTESNEFLSCSKVKRYRLNEIQSL